MTSNFLNMERYNSFSSYLKKTFHEKVYKLSFNGGMTCPNRDGTKGERGCIFCSGGGSGDFAEDIFNVPVDEAIERAKERISKKTNASKFIGYFQSFTNTYASTDYLEKLYTPLILHKDIVALSIGTRPDCIDDKIIDLLSKLNKIKPVFVELGLQTIHQETATLIRRGYDLDVFDTAVKKLKNANINVVVHLILGLPFESKEMMLQSVNYVGHCGADGIKLQLLHVLKDTDLATLYNEGKFETLSMEQYFDILKDALSILPKNMVIHRLTGDAPKKLLISPLWSANKKLVLNSLTKFLNENNIVQGSNYR